MRMTKIIKTAVWMAFFAGISTAGIKYVAVVETDVDAASGASAELNAAEVREITAELRRQAANNLPSGRYSVMTSETVQSMGGAVLEECAEENCVIALGSKIGADYIVRGTVSKFKTRFTLAVEMYETENGTLVVSSEAVRSENTEELLDKAAAASAEMYKKFAESQGAAQKSEKKEKTPTKSNADGEIKWPRWGAEDKPVKTVDTNAVKTGDAGGIKGRKFDYYVAPKYQLPIGTPVSWGGVNAEGGLVWGKGMFAGLDISYGDCEWGDVEHGSEDYGWGFEYGVGINFGNVYDLGNQLQLVYGGSLGIWWIETMDVPDSYNNTIIYGNHGIIAPFVRLRWKFVELTYRGILGIHYDDYIDWGNYSEMESNGLSWDHQVMLGVYFATSKRERR